MKKGIVALMLMAGVAFSMTSDASAALFVIGDPQLTGSWTQRFQKTGSDDFDRIDVFVIAGTALKGNGLERFSKSDWSGSPSSDGSHGSFSGWGTRDLEFDFHVWTDVPESFDVCFDTYKGGEWRDREDAHWDGENKKWDIHPGDSPHGAPVPEPGTMMLLGTGLIGLASFGRKKLRKK